MAAELRYRDTEKAVTKSPQSHLNRGHVKHFNINFLLSSGQEEYLLPRSSNRNY